MKYKIIWSAFSEQQIDNIFNYYKLKTKSHNVALKIIKKILLAPNVLIKNPKIGQKELLLENCIVEYHYLVESNYKIIYSIDIENKTRRIADVFDTRQNPTKIERQK